MRLCLPAHRLSTCANYSFCSYQQDVSQLRLHTAMSQSLSPDAWRKPKAGHCTQRAQSTSPHVTAGSLSACAGCSNTIGHPNIEVRQPRNVILTAAFVRICLHLEEKSPAMVKITHQHIVTSANTCAWFLLLGNIAKGVLSGGVLYMVVSLNSGTPK